MTTPPAVPVLRCRLVFPAGRGSGVERGIAFTRLALADWFPGVDRRAVWEAVLVTAELLANAASHAGGPLILDLYRIPENRVGIAVSDTSTDRPQLQPLSPHTPGGHGLRIVDRLARAWGSSPTTGGKTVWAEYDLAPPARSGG